MIFESVTENCPIERKKNVKPHKFQRVFSYFDTQNSSETFVCTENQANTQVCIKKVVYVCIGVKEETCEKNAQGRKKSAKSENELILV